MAKDNPLDSFKSDTASRTSFKMPQYPSLPDAVRENGLMKGIQVHHEQMLRYHEELERTITERLPGKVPVSTGDL